MKCPKCKSGELLLYEKLEEIEHREVIGGVLKKERLDHSVGESQGWRAECKDCSYEWTPRSASITRAIENEQ